MPASWHWMAKVQPFISVDWVPGLPGLPGLGLGGKTRAAKLTRLFFVAYLGVIHVLLFRVATAETSG